MCYNKASQIVSRTSANAGYDWTPAYGVSRTYQVNGLNQYTAAAGTGAASYLYDDNGNLRSDGASTFVYDAENRLVSASGGRNASLSYDPLGRLWQVTGTGGTTRFLYDGDKLVMELDGSGNVTRAYVHGPGADEPMAASESRGVASVHLNQTLRTATGGKVDSSLRADVTVVMKDGRVFPIEVPSGRQNAAFFETKYADVIGLSSRGVTVESPVLSTEIEPTPLEAVESNGRGGRLSRFLGIFGIISSVINVAADYERQKSANMYCALNPWADGCGGV